MTWIRRVLIIGAVVAVIRTTVHAAQRHEWGSLTLGVVALFMGVLFIGACGVIGSKEKQIDELTELLDDATSPDSGVSRLSDIALSDLRIAVSAELARRVKPEYGTPESEIVPLQPDGKIIVKMWRP
jgi:hypothetical protein